MTNCVFVDYLVRRHSHGMYKKVTYIRMRKIQEKKKEIKHLLITIKVQLIAISSVIPYISETNNTSSSLKKKKPSREEEERKKRWKRGEEERREKERESEREEEKGERIGKRENEMGKKRRKKRRENKREGEGEERRGRERRRENRESDTRNVPPSPDASPSTKLGDNTTPIKGRLRKNTTPTGRRSTETETESPGGSPAKTTKLRRFISHRFQLHTRKGRRFGVWVP